MRGVNDITSIGLLWQSFISWLLSEDFYLKRMDLLGDIIGEHATEQYADNNCGGSWELWHSLNETNTGTAWLNNYDLGGVYFIFVLSRFFGDNCRPWRGWRQCGVLCTLDMLYGDYWKFQNGNDPFKATKFQTRSLQLISDNKQRTYYNGNNSEQKT